MVFHATHSWTLFGLLRAFLDLALAYFLLWGSVFAFCSSKFFNFFGFFLPCPCTGILGYRNSNMCLYKLLFQWPTRKIYDVLSMVYGRFPFELIWIRDQEGNSNMKSLMDGRIDNRVLESDGGGCSNSFTGLRLQNLVDKESGCDAKGKKKHKSAIRRRRRAALGYEKSLSAVPLSGGETRSKASGSFGPVSEIEDGFPDDEGAQTCTYVGGGSCAEDYKVEKDLSSLKRFVSDTQEKVDIAANEADRIRMLENALQEVKAAHAAVFLELEKERSAAATAADEAMAMIVRLQQDKALIEMEARQYHRMIEEKFAYDEEEMNILKEVLVRKEKENHLLEKEVVAYRQMDVLRGEDSPQMLHQVTSGGTFDKKGVSKDASWLLDQDAPARTQSYSSLVGKEIASVNQDVDSNLFTSLAQIYGANSKQASFSHCEHSTPEKHVVVEGKTDADAEDGSSILCQRIPTKAVQVGGTKTSVFSGEGLERDGELRDQPYSKLKSSTLDVEPTIYDVHVIDDQIELRKDENEENVSESGLLTTSGERTWVSDLGRDSSSIVRNDGWRIDIRIEWLRERLRRVQEQKEKLTFSANQEERISAQLKVMEELMDRLHEL